MRKKHSLFERLSGSVASDDRYGFDDDFSDQRVPVEQPFSTPHAAAPQEPVVQQTQAQQIIEEEADAGQLPVDVFQTPDEIIIHAFVAGVRPDELNVSISRDIVVIEGVREERQQIVDSDYFTRELFWGSFARTILLPQEVDVESATANSKDGLLVITLPKLDRARQTKLRVKAG